MSDQVVVCFRSPEQLVEPEAYLAAARALVERGAALGGRLISWGGTVYAFAFDLDALQDAIELALSTGRDAAGGREHAVGISGGPLEQSDVAQAKLTLTWGHALVRAVAFARAARPGEVLVDPLLGAARKGELLTVGSRVGVYGKLRLRGLLLDVRHPWRTSLAESSRGLVRPALVLRDDVPDLDVEPGALALVRAPHGAGGSRLLEHIEQAIEPARTLHVTPHPFGEPLGALRRAMLRAVTLGQAPLNLPGKAGHSLDGLLAGEGLDPDSSAELVTAWLTPDSVKDPSGVVVLDDAAEMDADTLEVICRAVTSGAEPFRIVARLGDDEVLPEALDQLPLGQEIRMGPLPLEDATALAGLCIQGDLDEKIAARWANRGGRLPLGIVESVREALESGEIVWDDGRAVARLRTSGTGGARPPKHWIKRRLAHHDGEGRRVLEALAVLGGQAETKDLTEVVRRRDGPAVELEPTLAVLEAAGWVQRAKPDLLVLPSASHRHALLTAIVDADFQAWHLAACEAMTRRDRPLATAAATVHAVLAGDLERGRELARRAAAVARAVGLERTAEAFERFAEQGDLSLLSGRNLWSSQLEVARAVPSVWPGATRSSAPPSTDLEEVGPPPDPDPSSSVPMSGVSDSVSLPPSAARLSDVERGSAQSERLLAMAKIARGETGDAIRRLRDAADAAKRTRSRERCRTALALGVGLAAAGRHEEALLEVLEALARARETEDAKGERACLKFLAQLSAITGHHDAAEAWGAATEG